MSSLCKSKLKFKNPINHKPSIKFKYVYVSNKFYKLPEQKICIYQTNLYELPE
jgi:hypothetical protein